MPEFLSSINAKTALETPQIVLKWAFDITLETPLTAGILWLWDNQIIRRSKYRYPEDVTDGDSILNEAYSSDPTLDYADILGSLEALTSYYYSLFVQYTEHSTSPITLNQDISRLGTKYTGIVDDIRESFVSEVNGVTSIPAARTLTDVVTPATFLTDGVEAGFILHIHDGTADDGYYGIVSVDSETQITIDQDWPAGSLANLDYTIYTDHNKFWISGTDFHNKQVLRRWNTKNQMVDREIDLSTILNDGETVQAIPLCDILTATEYIGILTNTRYIRFDYTKDSPVLTDISVSFNLNTVMAAGYCAIGGSYNGTSLFILDSANPRYGIMAVTEATGEFLFSIDISAFDEVLANTVKGLSVEQFGAVERMYLANRNYVYSWDNAVGVSPDSGDIDYITYTRQLITADIDNFTNSLTSNVYLCIADDNINKFQSYDEEICRGYLWQQPYVSDVYSVGLYHLNDLLGAPVVDDSSIYNTDGTNVGMTEEEDGRFGTGYLADAPIEYIDLMLPPPGISILFDGNIGSISLWFKAIDADDLISSVAEYVCWIELGPVDYINIGIETGLLTFRYVSGAAPPIVIQAPHPSPDVGWHQYKLNWDIGGVVEAFVDGVTFDISVPHFGAPWGPGAPIIATIGGITGLGGPPGDTLLGNYDEVRITAGITRTVHATVQSYTDANKMHAFSGRDYTASYDDDNSLGFFYRDEIFTPKFMGGEYLIRNDYERSQLHPPNKVITDSEVIFRGPTPLPELGDLGRLSRLIGLFLDRISDSRQTMLDRYNFKKVDVDFIEDVANYLGIPGLDVENWNVDKQRRYIKIMREVLRRGGILNSYIIYAKLLGFVATESTLHARRRWDSVIYSVIDPYVSPIYLDEMGSMDTSDENFPLAFLRFLFYKRAEKGTTGATGAPAARTFTDAGGTFISDAAVGSLLKIYDLSSGGDNGEYVVVQVPDDTTLIVDQNWPVGNLANLTYTINWAIPEPDPYTEFLLTRFKDICPSAMIAQYLT